jgi:hypothetical protein
MVATSAAGPATHPKPSIELIRQSNMPRHQTSKTFPISLPVTVEVLVLVGSLVAGELFVIVSAWLILTERFNRLHDVFGITLPREDLASNFLPALLIIGFFVGFQIYFKVRRWLNVSISRLH